MSANTILIMYLLRKYSKLLTFRSLSAKISCPRIGIFGNPRKYHVREHFLSYSNVKLFLRNRKQNNIAKTQSKVFVWKKIKQCIYDQITCILNFILSRKQLNREIKQNQLNRKESTALTKTKAILNMNHGKSKHHLKYTM